MSIHVRATSKGRRYDVKLRSADGTQHSKTFATKKEATEYEARQLAALADGRYISPRAGATTVAELAERWLVAGNKRDSTRRRDRSVLVNHVVPALGSERQLARISRADCQALIDGWSAGGLAPRSVIRNAAVVRAMFQLAMDADLIARNPAARLKLPGVDPVERPTPTAAELERLAEVLGPDMAPFMWCGAVLGLRWSEAAGLTAGSVDLLGGTVKVSHQLDRLGQLVAPKTHGSIRALAAPTWLLEEIALLLRRRGLTGADSDRLVFANRDGGPLSYENWRARVWRPAVEAAGLPTLRFHDLRAVAASALVAAGVDLRTAMHRLGHTTPAMTLAVYARVAEDRDRAAADAVAARVAPARSAPADG